RQYRDEDATLDVITTPALAAPTPPPAAAPIVRLEEDDPAMRYSGQPYPRIAQSWSVTADQQVSQGYYLSTSTVGDAWRLDFSGVWVALGFRSTATSGTVEIFLDGASRGVFDTANGLNEVRQRVFADLAPGSHTVEAVVVDGTVMPDYIDVWDGAQVNDGWTDLKLNSEPPGLAHLSSRRWWLEIADEYAREDAVLGPFVNIATNAWFNFAGDSVTVLAYEADNTSLEVVIDGVSQGQVLLSPSAPFSAQPRALHFTGLGEGAHTVQVALPAINGARPRIDAFEVNPADTFSAVPEVEWFDDTALETLPGETRTGFISTIGVGDLDGDGLVELVAPSANGRLYVYRGDGQDAGSGSPILWTRDLAGPAAEPAIADLDGNGRAEIIVSGRDGTFAYRHDGQVLWSNTAVTSYFASQDLAWGGPSVANLDLDPEPELVIASIGDAVHVLDAQGNITFSEPLGSDFPTVPVLADLTGDGVLDLIVAETWTLRVIDLFNGGTEVWRRELPDPIVVAGGAGAFGGPAIADLDGDGGAEVIINWGHIVEALESDGSLLWRYETNRTDLYRPSPVTVADVTGDGQRNVVTASAINAGFVVNDHLLQVLDEGGSLVWEQDVADNSASASGVSAQDLTGNGAWEIIWNGAADGFLVFNGADGERLFNEPYTGSGTVLDYPTLADVDGDRQAEVVVAGANGLFVIGHTGRWVDSRPVWNQHNYHINNINGDWSVPFTEENSWEAHNTYRTQTPERDPGCVAVDGALVPPRVVDLTPAGGAVLPAGVSLVVSGRVIPVAPTQPLRDVLIDGRPVDIFDASGSFFSVVSLDAGLNEFTLQAADGCATAEVSLSL
ncbi:MAG: VCBS repeat-containing protein, partial [Pseudomonadota bacterium]